MVKSQHKESKEIIEKLIDAKIIPVIKIDSPQEAVPLARALLQGGITVAEVTFRTEAAADGIAAIHAQVPEMLLGAGTVLTVENAQKAIDAGARFVVAPGFDPAVVDYVVEQGIAMIPGVATPTEVSLALGRGLHILKFFPAEVLGGIKMLDAFCVSEDIPAKVRQCLVDYFHFRVKRGLQPEQWAKILEPLKFFSDDEIIAKVNNALAGGYMVLVPQWELNKLNQPIDNIVPAEKLSKEQYEKCEEGF